ncbi:hypothetical protein LC087_11380 [Bacillus carboniphilus]|uniref:Flagellar protein n=1 Tax=Bacillus carboniphilus TaxID=86663 RepID=A0ABY9JSW3_9BACI|nr:TIGR03826 family flagellar region protein [Bacillus carboniphilus]WLR41492.1 hypothetical protein LC087_11380 [Bacillus carboniphilus]
MEELSNCPNCNRLFIQTQFQPICLHCKKNEDEKFQQVHTFLKTKKNRMATMQDVIEQTGIEEELILKFIRQRRLQLSHFPNICYSCEKCGEPIRKGKICLDCANEIKKGLEQSVIEKEEPIHSNNKTYYSVDLHKDH